MSYQISPEQSAEARALAEQLKTQSGMSFTEAWNLTRRSRPDLFSPIHNRVVGERIAILCNDGHAIMQPETETADETQFTPPPIEKCTYGQAIHYHGYKAIPVWNRAQQTQTFSRDDNWTDADERNLSAERDNAVAVYRNQATGMGRPVTRTEAWNAVRRLKPELFPV